MKRFLFRLTLFFITFAVICIIPCWIFEKKAKECTDREPYSRINMVDNLKDFDADVVVLGNSRAECGYVVPILDSLTGKKWVNLGISGYTFDIQYNLMYKRYLEQNKKPQFIILETSTITSFSRSLAPYNIEMLPYVGHESFKSYTNMCPELTFADKIMFVKYFGKLDLVAKELKKFERPETEVGLNMMAWETKNGSVNQKYKFNVEIMESFCGFLDECVAEDVKVILVCSPVYGDPMKRTYDMDRFWRNIKYFTAGKKVPILSYQDLYCRDRSFFSDPIHLNEYGGECFSIRLAHDLDSLGLLK